MNKRFITGTLTTLALPALLLLSGPALSADKVPSAAAVKALAEAKVAIDAAKQAKWIWRDTEQFHAQAQDAAMEGNDDKAIKLASKAKAQAEAALKQKSIEASAKRGL